MTTEKIAIVGLGYVGLPVAVALAEKYDDVIGFDISNRRVESLRKGTDWTGEISDQRLAAASLDISDDAAALAGRTFIIVTVPTPIDDDRRPDLEPIRTSCKLIAPHLAKGTIVVFESTVYPGVTDDLCGPLLEELSGLRRGSEFFLGYSPERINPGDKQHRLPTITKVTSGSTAQAADFIDGLYRSIITAGTHKAPSIKVAEAAKVIENTQRDLNIALMNELTIIFNKMGIDTEAVLEAAGTKWNFLPFRPGLVGGHCIGVDPYYLTHKAEAIGYHPQVILAGRRINDGMGAYVVGQLVKLMLKRRIGVEGANVLILGLAFKENCPDLRNTKVVDIIRELGDYNVNIDVFDPWVSVESAEHEYGIRPVEEPVAGKYDAIVLAVAHREFYELGTAGIRRFGKENHVLYDLKYVLSASDSDARL